MNKKWGLSLGIIGLLVVFYFGYQAYATQQLKRVIDTNLAKLHDQADIQYHGLSFNPFNNKIILSGLSITFKPHGNQYQINQLMINKFDKQHKTPHYLSLAINGINIDFNNLDEESKIQLQNLGYSKQLTANFTFDYAYDEKNKDLYINKFNLNIEQMATLSTHLHIGNIPLDDKTAGITMMYLYPSFLFHSAKFELTDDSLTQRFIKLQAKQLNISEAAAKQNLIAKLNAEIPQDAFRQQMLKSAEDFINTPKRIALIAEPEKAVSFAQILQSYEHDPNSLIALLALKVVAN